MLIAGVVIHPLVKYVHSGGSQNRQLRGIQFQFQFPDSFTVTKGDTIWREINTYYLFYNILHRFALSRSIFYGTFAALTLARSLTNIRYRLAPPVVTICGCGIIPRSDIFLYIKHKLSKKTLKLKAVFCSQVAFLAYF